MRPFALLLVLLAAPCCSPSLTIDSDYDTSTDFSKYKTWDWFPGLKPQEKDVDTLTQQRIRSAIEAELPHCRVSKVTENPDLHAAFQLSIQRKIESNPTTVGVGYGWGPARIGVSSSGVRTYDEGTLLVDLIDAKTKTLVWRGSAVGTVHQSSSAEERQERINSAVRYILEGFPPAKK